MFIKVRTLQECAIPLSIGPSDKLHHLVGPSDHAGDAVSHVRVADLQCNTISVATLKN